LRDGRASCNRRGTGGLDGLSRDDGGGNEAHEDGDGDHVGVWNREYELSGTVSVSMRFVECKSTFSVEGLRRWRGGSRWQGCRFRKWKVAAATRRQDRLTFGGSSTRGRCDTANSDCERGKSERARW
jgi:hypothetical protein